MPEGTERRHGGRLELSTRVHVKAEEQPETVLMSHDWTDRSVFLRTHHPLPLGTMATLSVVIPHQPKPVVMDSIVARVVESEHQAPTLPPGMALHFGTMPLPLKQHLTGLRERSALTTSVEAKAMPPVLVVASSAGDRLTAAHALEAAGYDVTEANTPSGVQNALTLGPQYQAILLLATIKRSEVVGLVKKMSVQEEPAITIDEPEKTLPSALTEAVNCPIVILPANAAAAEIRDAVAVHVKPTTLHLEGLDPRPLDPAMPAH